MGEIFRTIFYEPLYNAVVVLYHATGDNLGLAIIAIALISRFIMIPLTLRQIKMSESSREFSEKAKEIKEKYKKDKEAQQKELMKLQSEYLPAQIAGCLPMIFQFIFFIYLYNVIKNMINVGASGFNEVAYSFVSKFPDGYQINSDFFGLFDIKSSASSVGFNNTHIIPYIILILLVGASQYGSMKILMALRGPAKKEEEKSAEVLSKHEKRKKNREKKKKESNEDFAEILQQSSKQTMLFMPFLIMFISYGLPAGLSLYWISQSGFVIIQQLVITRIQKWRRNVSESAIELTQNQP